MIKCCVGLDKGSVDVVVQLLRCSLVELDARVVEVDRGTETEPVHPQHQRYEGTYGRSVAHGRTDGQV